MPRDPWTPAPTCSRLREGSQSSSNDSSGEMNRRRDRKSGCCPFTYSWLCIQWLEAEGWISCWVCLVLAECLYSKLEELFSESFYNVTLLEENQLTWIKGLQTLGESHYLGLSSCTCRAEILAAEMKCCCFCTIVEVRSSPLLKYSLPYHIVLVLNSGL